MGWAACRGQSSSLEFQGVTSMEDGPVPWCWLEKSKPLRLCGSLFSLFLVQEAERTVYRSRGLQDLTPELTDQGLVVGPSGQRRPGCVQVTPAWLTWSGADAALDGGSVVEKSGVHSAGGGTTERFAPGDGWMEWS
uniref:Uncharacterized protein n=1 Tax=Rangifer tarandus platyrhynchus TaxID=3082113 RepID=A0ACB0EH61_RANTA|nr:unnamed protein product [Rangifer tarandus platyrhynchus]